MNMVIELSKYNAQIVYPEKSFEKSTLYFDERIVQLKEKIDKPIFRSDEIEYKYILKIYFQKNTSIGILFKTDEDRKMFMQDTFNL
jgi:hypothetical protein